VFSTAWNAQRSSQSYIEKRRRRRELEVTRRRRGEVKRIQKMQEMFNKDLEKIKKE